MTHPMLQESWDEAVASAQIGHDQRQAQQPEPAPTNHTEDAEAF